jgi:Protein of unknown function (DUF3105)
MARKDRAPTPPRRVQAPRQRRAPIKPEDARRQRLILYGIAASGVLGLVVVVLVIAFGRGGGPDVAAVMKEAGCTLQEYPGVARNHINNPAAQPKSWNSFPPTSGPHYVTPAVYDFYNDAVQLARVLHNLEHGGVYMLYGPKTPSDTSSKLREIYDKDPRGLVVAPLPKLGDKIALGAWTSSKPGTSDLGTGRLAKCTKVDAKAFETFIDAYRGKGPEGFPLDALQPGGT